jgi:hypothetical protein
VAKLPITLDYDYIHVDDTFDLGPSGLNAVRYIGIDREAVEARNTALIRERIAHRYLNTCFVIGSSENA